MTKQKGISKTDIIEIIISGLIGALCITTALLGYCKFPPHMFELTFISNLLVGCIFIFNSVYMAVTGRSVPSVILLSCTALLLVVFLTCIAFIGEMNFSGVFLFLHVINPVCVLLFWAVLGNAKSLNKKAWALTGLIIPFIYFVFAFIYGETTGNYLYGFLNIEIKGLAYVLSFGGIALSLLAVLCFALYFLNYIIQTRLFKLN